MRRFVTLTLCSCIVLLSCGSEEGYKRIDFDFFSLISPASLNKAVEGEGFCLLDGEIGSIDLAWSFDQFSREGMPSRESGRKHPGEEIIESTKATLGERRIWWNKTRRDNIITVRMTIPLDSGYLKAEGNATEQSAEAIEKSIRSIVINDESYFINTDD